MDKVFLAALGVGIAGGAKYSYVGWKGRYCQLPDGQRRISNKAFKRFEWAVIGLLTALAAYFAYFIIWFALGSNGYIIPAPLGINYP